MHASNFAHMTTTHTVNVSARLLWVDITVCSMIHYSRSMAKFMRGMHSNNHNPEICTSVYMLSNSIQPLSAH